MATRIYQQSEHDMVVEASAQTYDELKRQGYKVSTNAGEEKNQRVGTDRNPQYPDVVVWKPESPDSATGTAVIIEEIETAESVNQQEAEQWKGYGELGIGTFRLIVPATEAKVALQIVQDKKIRVTEIWYYELKPGKVSFTKYISLA